MLRRTSDWKSPRERAQGLVEFALILPVLLVTIFVIIELARLLHAWMAIENGARFGVRYAVTGEYDVAFCLALPEECGIESEEDRARIESIKDAANAGAVAILKDPSVLSVGDPGFFKITVCSSKKDASENPLFHYKPSDPNTPLAAECLENATLSPVEDPGGPGDRVSVTIDYDHPVISPFISSVWPKFHLSASREGIVERYRTARVVGLPPTISGPTPTPSNTPTPSDTPTPSSTPTETRTPTPTPTPSCSDIDMTRMWISGDDVEANIRNRNVATAYLVQTHLEWEKLRSQMYSNEFELNNFEYWPGDDDRSPTDVSSPMGFVPLPGGGNTDRWEGDFNGEPYEPIWGDYRLELTFDFPDWDGGPCTVAGNISIEQQPPPPTRTPRPTSTEGPPPEPTSTKKSSPTAEPKPTDPVKPTSTLKPTDRPPEGTPPPNPDF